MSRFLLPYYGNAADVDKVVQYLRTKPTGVSESDVGKTLGASVVDARKFDFYDVLGLFTRQNGYKLTARGLDYLHGDQEQRHLVIREALKAFPPYYQLIEWAFHNAIDVLDADRVKHEWAGRFSDLIDLENSYRLQAAPLAFFSAVEMAGLGQFLIGRRGSKSRIEFDRDAVGRAVVQTDEIAPTLPLTIRPMSSEIASPASSVIERGTEPAPRSGEFTFVVPVYGKTARIVWSEPTMTQREWEKLKRVGDAMFGEGDE